MRPVVLGAALALAAMVRAVSAEEAAAEKATNAAPVRTTLDDVYRGYRPDFLHWQGGQAIHRAPQGKENDLSGEPSFFTLTLLNESDRVYALVKAAVVKEQEGDYLRAMDIYQMVIDTYPDSLFRVSESGVFVPASRYCQMRILRFPKVHLDAYRTKYDAAAQEAYGIARQRNSLEGLARIRDTMLCTSYGAPAMLLLGDMALDRGHHLEALEYYNTVREFFPDPEVATPELLLKIQLCHKELGDKDRLKEATDSSGRSEFKADELATFARLVSDRPLKEAVFAGQRASAPFISMDDYAAFPPSEDPLGLLKPEWKQELEGAQAALFVFTQPVVTDHNVVYRHRNLIYCRSLLNGELRWKCDLGGRRKWQNLAARQLPMDDLVVGNGLVFAPLFRQGANLVALDEITGQLRWSYGPMSAVTEEETMMSFGAAPALGGGAVYAGYVLNDLRGVTHVDTEYGLMAFEAVSGRVLWRRPLCRLRPGKFASGVTTAWRVRIRSFESPPLYHEGTVYHVTNAGGIAALDALSGQIKWIMRYPYIEGIHDATQGYGRDYTQGSFGGPGIMLGTSEMFAPMEPMLWYNQRPLLVGDHLYTMPVNAQAMFKIDRRTGKIAWTRRRRDRLFHSVEHASSYFLGPVPTGEMAEVFSFRHSGAPDSWKGRSPKGSVFLFDPKTGQDVWLSEDTVVVYTNHPTVYSGVQRGHAGSSSQPVTFTTLAINGWPYKVCARPFVASDGTLTVGQFSYRVWPIFGSAYNLASVDLRQRKVTARRNFLGGVLLGHCATAIEGAPYYINQIEKLPNRPKELEPELAALKAVANDTVPVNPQPEFRPFSRMTFHRFGTLFELRLDGRSLAMVYDRAKVKQAVEADPRPEARLAAAELAIGDRRIADAAQLLTECLAATPPENLNFRTMVNQQLYLAHKRLAQGRIRARDGTGERAHVLGMSRSVTSLADEIETWFAVADASEHKGDWTAVGASLRKLIECYGQQDYALPALAVAPPASAKSTVSNVVRHAGALVAGTPVTTALTRVMGLAERALPLYSAALSPLERELKVRVGDWATVRMLRLREEAPAFAKTMDDQARTGLEGKPVEEATALLASFPGTPAAGETLARLMKEFEARLKNCTGVSAEAAMLRKTLWKLSDTARMTGVDLPEASAVRWLAPTSKPACPPVAGPLNTRSNNLADASDTAWKLMDTQGEWDPGLQAKPLFLAGRVKRRVDTKFILRCLDADTGRVGWQASEPRSGTWFDDIRLGLEGDEPGFARVFLHKDLAVTHGMFDVLAFGLADGKFKWRFTVPVGFEILSAQSSGDILVLSGLTGTLALYLPTSDPRGELIWQQKEDGAPYAPAYFHGDRWVSVRAMPFNVTVRCRSTGRLMGRLTVPDLLMNEADPVIETGPRATPVAHDGGRLALYSGYGVVMVDVETPRILWKCGLGESFTPMRMAMGGGFLAIAKKEYDRTVLYMLSGEDGRTLWATDAKTQVPAPLYGMQIRNGTLYGLGLHPGQGFVLVGLEGATGKPVFAANQQDGYGGKPEARLHPEPYEKTLVVEVKDRQDFELKAFDLADGKLVHAVRVKGTGAFGEHGRASAAVQHGRMALLGGNVLMLAGKEVAP